MQRPVTLDGMLAALDRFVTREGTAQALAFQPHPSDVIITPFGKCGTTWMQQIVHGLRSGGDMSFDEISAVVPWIELAHDMGIDISAPQAQTPRAFKSHLTWHDIPKGGRYIVVLRDPLDAMVSMYRFFDGWFFARGSVRLNDFAEYYLAREEVGRDFWTHAASWWGVRDRADVLVLAYEHMKRDLPGTVRRVAGFIGIDDGAAIDIATRQAAFDFMKAHDRQFDDHLTRASRDSACGLPPGSEASKVDRGLAGQGKPQVSDEIRALYAAHWQDVMGAAFDLPDYSALLAVLARETRA
ncbi:MAG: sulfotransferase domain-containing protein [Pseudomonadota bacterium]